MIVLDDRVGSKEGKSHDLFDPLTAFGVPVMLGRLEYGDLAFQGRSQSGTIAVGVELKTIPDLLSSMVSGRLVNQCRGMVLDYGQSWLCIEDSYRITPEGTVTLKARSDKPLTINGKPLTYKAMESFLLTLNTRGGIHVKRTRDQGETVRWISALYHWWTDQDLEDHSGLKVLYRHRDDGVWLARPTLRRYWAQDCPGIGFDRSVAIEDHFKSARALANADEHEWRSIPGVGKTLASRIVEAITRED